MSGVYRRGDAWYLRWRDASGVIQRKATTARTRAEAQKLLVDILAREERVRLGLEARELNPHKMTLRELAEWYVRKILPHQSNPHVVQSRLNVHVLTSELADLPIQQITSGQIEGMLASLKKRRTEKGEWVLTDEPLSAQSINHVRTLLVMLFTHAVRHGLYLGQNPVTAVRKRRVKSGGISTLTAEEVPAVLDAAESPWREIFAVAIYAGLRKGELFGLKKEEIDLEHGIIHVRRSHGRESTKGGKTRGVPIHPELRSHLASALLLAGDSEWLFPGEDGQRRHERSNTPARLQTVLRRAGISRHIRFHDLRHTCATLLLTSGADLGAVQRILGHSTPVLTMQTYGHLTSSYLAEQMQKFTTTPRLVTTENDNKRGKG